MLRLWKNVSRSCMSRIYYYIRLFVPRIFRFILLHAFSLSRKNRSIIHKFLRIFTIKILSISFILYYINIKINKYENRRAISRSLRRYRKYEKETVSRSLNFHRIHENLTVKCLSNDVHEFNSRYNFEVSTRNRQVSDIDLPFFSFFFFLSPEVTELHTR